MKIYSSTLAPAAKVAFTSQEEGNLAGHVGDDPFNVARNRESLEKQLGLTETPIAYMNQVHSAVVAEPASPGQDAPTADGLISAAGNQPMAVLVADCVPLVFVGVNEADGAPVTAVAHAGRKGLLDGIIENTVAELRTAGATSFEAWIGPSICGSCYEVPQQMQEDAEATHPGIASTTSWDTPALDLPRTAAQIVRELGGIPHETHECTLENDSYFSYRRDSKAGRLAGLVWLSAEGQK
ncbi:polyphenol oxidase family protein [Neomicrococcus aestuarii]|uniref:Purine nucleoside phosphorylase n=1 Tax=Neomicrococcus aestuarii TaxID=556325 RepID=A0A1L2ZK16_9MICC|nr:polyphenol oxidase family protein [Neomicrococcus aestuarii]APF39735.1 hypothetical protein BHE16_00420 [Neomicrococcus aestuarii]